MAYGKKGTKIGGSKRGGGLSLKSDMNMGKAMGSGKGKSAAKGKV